MTRNGETLTAEAEVQVMPVSAECAAAENDPVVAAKRKLGALAAWAAAERERHANEIVGDSSFLDVVGNLEAALAPYIRYAETDKDPEDRAEDLAVIACDIAGFQTYEEICIAHPEILKAEMTRHEGASFALRTVADKGPTPKGAICRYVELLKELIDSNGVIDLVLEES